MKCKVKINWTKKSDTKKDDIKTDNHKSTDAKSADVKSDKVKSDKVKSDKPIKSVKNTTEVNSVKEVDGHLGDVLSLDSSNKKPDKIKKLKNEITKLKKLSIKELNSLQAAPEGMSQGEWEKRISIERLSSLYLSMMKEYWDVEFPLGVKERSMFKNYCRYFNANLSLSEDVMRYVITNWTGIKARYRLPYEYPMPGTFAYLTFIKQVAIEYHKKVNVTNKVPEYISDFDTRDNEVHYESDF